MKWGLAILFLSLTISGLTQPETQELRDAVYPYFITQFEDSISSITVYSLEGSQKKIRNNSGSFGARKNMIILNPDNSIDSIVTYESSTYVKFKYLFNYLEDGSVQVNKVNYRNVLKGSWKYKNKHVFTSATFKRNGFEKRELKITLSEDSTVTISSKYKNGKDIGNYTQRKTDTLGRTTSTIVFSDFKAKSQYYWLYNQQNLDSVKTNFTPEYEVPYTLAHLEYPDSIQAYSRIDIYTSDSERTFSCIYERNERGLITKNIAFR